MTYAKIILPYEPTKNEVSVSPEEKQNLKGKLKSALNKAGSVVKGAIENPTQAMKNLSGYLQQNQDKILNKFSGIAFAQLMVDGKITNKSALDYLFLGCAPALNQTAIALGYSGVNQLKSALTGGTIKVGSFVNGFQKILKDETDLKNKKLNIKNFTSNDVIELDVTYSHQEQYLSEVGDRRVQEGITWAEFVHNLPETFNLTCGIQDGKRYSVQEFKSTLKLLRDKKMPFSLVIDEDIIDNVILLNFAPVREGATNGLEYSLEFKKVRIGMVEIVPITIQALPTTVQNSTTTGTGEDVTMPKITNQMDNPYLDAVIKKPANRSMLKQLQMSFGGE